MTAEDIFERVFGLGDVDSCGDCEVWMKAERIGGA